MANEPKTVQEASAALRVSDETVRRMVKSGDQLTGFRAGAQWRVHADSLQRLMSEPQQPQQPQQPHKPE